MAFSATYVQKINMGNGLIMELGTWSGASVTTGTITADVTEQPEITEILAGGAMNDADNDVACNRNAANTMKMTFTSNDTGDYWLLGKAK